MLIALAGLPGTGKTTLARALAARRRAVLVRIDSLEQGIVDSALGVATAADAGYRAAYALAGDNLALGHTVIADSVNPIGLTRDAWRAVADRAGVPLLDVEVVCSDLVEHRRRVEGRRGADPDARLPTWAQVQARAYHPWDRDRLVIDTAGRGVEAALADVLRSLDAPQYPA